MGEKGAQFFRQSFELKIKGDMIPESAVESIIGELQDLFARHGAGAALSAKAVFKPTKDFHTARHTLFTAEQNLEIDSRACRSVRDRRRESGTLQGRGHRQCLRQRCAGEREREN